MLVPPRLPEPLEEIAARHDEHILFLQALIQLPVVDGKIAEPDPQEKRPFAYMHMIIERIIEVLRNPFLRLLAARLVKRLDHLFADSHDFIAREEASHDRLA